MTTMLENVAKAIAGAESCGGWDSVTPDWQPLYFDMARAALTAIRDLDSGDINDGGLSSLTAGKRALYSCSEDPELADARGCFHAMIDAILNEKPEAGQ